MPDNCALFSGQGCYLCGKIIKFKKGLRQKCTETVISLNTFNRIPVQVVNK